MEFPASGARWRDTFLCVLGALIGYWRAPLALLMFGPFRLAAAVYAMAGQESLWGARPVGDDGTSIGMLHWNDVNDTIPGELRESPFWSGYYVPSEIQKAMLQSLWWWLMALPFTGFYQLRFLWIHGPSEQSGRPPGAIQTARHFLRS